MALVVEPISGLSLASLFTDALYIDHGAIEKHRNVLVTHPFKAS
jgi:uncharacterized membrane protein YozB (DUF420 family)